MGTPTVNDFRDEFPEFARVSDDKISRCIKRACRIHDDLPAATLYAAAHLYSTDLEKGIDENDPSPASPDGGAGVVTSESIGSRSVSYRDGAGHDDRRVFFQRTPYGREFLKLEERNPRQAFGMTVAKA